MFRLGRMQVMGTCLMFVSIGTLAVGQRTLANTGLADATTTDPNNPTPCSACHVPGREEEGRGSLNAVGQQFFFNCRQSQVHDCHTLPQFVAVRPAPSPAPYRPPVPAPNPAPYVPPYAPPYASPNVAPRGQLQYATAVFTDNCQSGDSHFVIRPAGGGTLIEFVLKHFHNVHLRVPIGSTYALSCDGRPNPGNAVQPVTFE